MLFISSMIEDFQYDMTVNVTRLGVFNLDLGTKINLWFVVSVHVFVFSFLVFRHNYANMTV